MLATSCLSRAADPTTYQINTLTSNIPGIRQVALKGGCEY
jgi:hypothetical protein